MEFQEAFNTLEQAVKNTDNYEDFKGFDSFYDSFWSGYYSKEIKLDNGNYLYFDGNISFNVEDGEIKDFEIEKSNDFELFGEDGETIINFLNK